MFCAFHALKEREALERVVESALFPAFRIFRALNETNESSQSLGSHHPLLCFRRPVSVT